MFSRVVYFANMFGLRSSGGSYEKLNEQFDLDTPFFQVCLPGICRNQGNGGVFLISFLYLVASMIFQI